MGDSYVLGLVKQEFAGLKKALRSFSAHQPRKLWIIAQQQAPARNSGQLGSWISHCSNAPAYLR